MHAGEVGTAHAAGSARRKAAKPTAARPARKVLVAAHAHPQFSKGGAEIASFALFESLNALPGYEAWFLACVRDELHQKLGATFSQPFSAREYVYSSTAFDWFKFANWDPKFPAEFRALLETLRPDIVHFHHYVNFGVEAFLHVREVLPNCRIVVTLHEYLALCHHYGQMITKQHRTLCPAATPTRCTSCFPERSPADFFLRTAYIRRFFDLVDRFTAPSRFLAERYIAWGIDRERIAVLENMADPGTPAAVIRARDPQLLRVGFFGQVSLLKGINVLLEAAALLAEREVDDVVVEIHGEYAGQPREFQDNFAERLAKAGRNVQYRGPYDPAHVDGLMRVMDVIVVPSIWWENSPVVIQEALRNGRPVICSDIGGMAEKVRDGQDGWHVPVGNPLALAALLQRLARSPAAVTAMAQTVRAAESAADLVARYDELYAALLRG